MCVGLRAGTLFSFLKNDRQTFHKVSNKAYGAEKEKLR